MQNEKNEKKSASLDGSHIDKYRIELRNQRYVPLDRVEEMAMIKLYQTTGNEGVCRELIERNTRYVLSKVRKYVQKFPDTAVMYMELVCAGNDGLVTGVYAAKEHFDLSKGFRLQTYLNKSIEGAIDSFVEERSKIIERPKTLIDVQKEIRTARDAFYTAYGCEPLNSDLYETVMEFTEHRRTVVHGLYYPSYIVRIEDCVSTGDHADGSVESAIASDIITPSDYDKKISFEDMTGASDSLGKLTMGSFKWAFMRALRFLPNFRNRVILCCSYGIKYPSVVQDIYINEDGSEKDPKEFFASACRYYRISETRGREVRDKTLIMLRKAIKIRSELHILREYVHLDEVVF